MKALSNTKTEQNLLKSFIFESQSRTLYDFFSEQAKEEGFIQISNIFSEVALNEKEHAKRFLKFLKWLNMEVTSNFPVWKIWTTLENLEFAIELENKWRLVQYYDSAQMAEQEWFNDIAEVFRMVWIAEKAHEDMFKKLHKNISIWNVFIREEVVIWKCIKCGYLYSWNTAPDECLSCLYSQSYFQIQGNNF